MNEVLKSGDVILGMTDKSGKVILSTKKTFDPEVKRHIADDKTITADEVKAIEENSNLHCTQWRKILGLGTK